ncbi:MAG: hypothetical protein M1820_008889 [Bogoriella megaspora]|nr:MAG: hypothetical protein M1820_008889 [Bogoriella megaspora]
MASVQSLPAEIQLMILLELTSTADIHSLLLASRDFYQVFNLYRVQIIASVIQKSFGSDLLSYASSAILGQRRQLTAHDIVVSDYKTLYRWLIGVHKMVYEYAAQATDKFTAVAAKYRTCQVRTEKVSRTRLTLSSTEFKRIARAFIHFEVFCKSFGSLKNSGYLPSWHVQHPKHHTWFEGLAPWERIEFIAVYQYLMCTVESVCKGVEDYLVEFVKTTTEEQMTSASAQGLLRGELKMFCLDLFMQSVNTRTEQISFLVELGLPFIKKFRKMGKTQQLQVLCDSCDELYHSYVSSFHEFGSIERFAGIDKGLCSFEDSVDSPSLGVCWRTAYGPRLLTYSTGYIFWDKPRLESLGLFMIPDGDGDNPDRDSDSLDMVLGSQAIGYRDWNLLRNINDESAEREILRLCNKRPSVEDRLLGKPVDRDALQELMDGGETFYSTEEELKIWVDSIRL